ncbi:Hypothetical predicted protein [Olea europaea subsp. europaea]|uniref:Uncharacterized protein n=1 Tax=Olea europaea subsp. europaea TaxID=158383 RepID=A0A8S0RCW1_OLEEU|nr:Hypothetical predicted protein [Olea europaea subsp. europaea]
MASPLWHNSGAYPAPRVPQQPKLENIRVRRRRKTRDIIYKNGEVSMVQREAKGSYQQCREIRSRRKRLPLRLPRRHSTEATEASVTKARSWPSVQSNTQLYLVRLDQGGSRWPPSSILDLGPVFSLTRRVVLNPPRSRGIEIEWHVGRNAGATGASVAVGAPGLDHGPVFNTDTKGDRDGEA